MQKEIKITVPTDWKDITLQSYQRYIELGDTATLESTLEAFTSLTIKDLRILEKDSVEELLQAYVDLLNSPTDNLDVITKVTIQGNKLGFIPNLDNLSYGEYLDIIEYMKDWKSMHLAMEVLYRDIIEERVSKRGIKQYSISKYGEKELTGEIGLQLPMDVVFGALVFFYNLTKELLNHFPNYMERLLENQTEDLPKDLVRNGEATKQYIPLLMETLEDLKKLLHYR